MFVIFSATSASWSKLNINTPHDKQINKLVQHQDDLTEICSKTAVTERMKFKILKKQDVYTDTTRKCTLWRCKSTPIPKAKLLWMTSHYGPTVVRSVTEIPFHVFI